MKKLTVLFIILTLIITGCAAPQEKKKPLTKDQIIARMQKYIKATDSISLDATNKTTVSYDKFTTKFTQDTASQFDTISKSALLIKAKSNNTKYPVKSVIFNMDNGNVEAFPEPSYLNYRARNADIQYFSSVQSNMVNLTDIIQNVIKKEAEQIKTTDNSIQYKGNSQSLKYLFDYGIDFSSMNQVATFNDLTDIKIQSGSFNIELSPVKKLPKILSFDIKVNAKIKNKPVTILMTQDTYYKDFNKTNVSMYKADEID
ncbi:hypothetical protein ETI06_11650 [Macrococcoides goetzii]|nr:hypothetical protein [Macrococcus goetzii]TDM39608.1 hypothetical protein ETI10_09175 [Macrococcus goetzii]TDM41507.1 hypothetical protein ETI08_11920 [Macrococcus goetzii]TDM46885.1 hypothetical protein ETI06_11650 [Macrococcus goetzii]